MALGGNYLKISVKTRRGHESRRERLCGVMSKLYSQEIREFELQSRYSVHFLTHTLGKAMNLLISRAMH